MNVALDQAADARGQAVAVLSTLTAKMNASPEDAAPVAEALERVLDIAAYAPGGWGSLVDCLKASNSLNDVLSFCMAFAQIVAVEGLGDPTMTVAHDPVFAM